MPVEQVQRDKYGLFVKAKDDEDYRRRLDYREAADRVRYLQSNLRQKPPSNEDRVARRHELDRAVAARAEAKQAVDDYVVEMRERSLARQGESE